MSVENSNNSESGLGSLGGCLVEGDPEQRKRERRIRRRALAISIGLQSIALVAVVLFPLFGKTERIVMAGYVPIPPYSHHVDSARQHAPSDPRRDTSRLRPCFACPTAPIHQNPTTQDHSPEPPGDPFGPGNPTGNDTDKRGFIDALDNRLQPAGPPEDPPRTTARIHETQIDPAMLIRRIEPVYPTLPRQMGRAGKIELRAIIATDGTIQSLQVVSGDPLFYQSALDAVRQWRYRPTYLNGRAVEVDTFITVVYTMNR